MIKLLLLNVGDFVIRAFKELAGNQAFRKIAEYISILYFTANQFVNRNNNNAIRCVLELSKKG